MKQRILKQVSALVFCSVVVTFIVVTMALYTQFGRFMQETSRSDIFCAYDYIILYYICQHLKKVISAMLRKAMR